MPAPHFQSTRYRAASDGTKPPHKAALFFISHGFFDVRSFSCSSDFKEGHEKIDHVLMQNCFLKNASKDFIWTVKALPEKIR